jgi:hypothetical protein
MIQVENRWTDLVEIWYGRYARGVYPIIVLFSFIQIVIPTWRTNERTCEVGLISAPIGLHLALQ